MEFTPENRFARLRECVSKRGQIDVGTAHNDNVRRTVYRRHSVKLRTRLPEFRCLREFESARLRYPGCAYGRGSKGDRTCCKAPRKPICLPQSADDKGRKSADTASSIVGHAEGGCTD